MPGQRYQRRLFGNVGAVEPVLLVEYIFVILVEKDQATRPPASTPGAFDLLEAARDCFETMSRL